MITDRRTDHQTDVCIYKAPMELKITCICGLVKMGNLQCIRKWVKMMKYLFFHAIIHAISKKL